MQTIIYKEMMDGLKIEHASRDEKYDMVLKHWHSECEIVFMLQGERYFFIDNQTYRVGKGCLAIIDSNQLHRTDNAKEFYHDRILLQVDKNKFAKSALAYGINIIDFFKDYQGVIRIEESKYFYTKKIFDDIASEIQRKEKGYNAIVQFRMLELWSLVIRSREKLGTSHDKLTAMTEKHQLVYNVANYICDNYKDVRSLNDIAKKFYVSKSYLSRIYKEVTGFTVNQYINIQKVRQAQRLLEDTEYDITQIAREVGYDNNVTYFSKVFHKYAQITALKYRKTKTEYKKRMRK